MGSGPSRGVASPRGSRSRVASSSSRLAASSGEVRSTGAHAAPRVGLADGRASGPGETATSRGQPVSSPVTSSLRKGEGEGGRGRPGRRWRVSACFVTRPRRVHATRVRGRGTHHAYPAARSTARCTASASTFPGPRRDATWSHSAETRTRIELSRASRCELFGRDVFLRVFSSLVDDRRFLPFTPAGLGWKIESPSQRGATIGARARVWRMSQTR